MTAPEGIHADRVSAWMLENIEGAVAPFEFEFISGGRSNLTFKVTAADGRAMVLRRPPISHVLATAHDMGREHKIISALAGTPVPVPRAVGFCQDEAVNDRPFYVMDFVDGHILRSAQQAEAALTVEQREAAGRSLIDVLAAIHSVDPDAVGLGDLGRRDGYIERQLKRWYGQFRQSQEQEKESGIFRPAEVVDEVHDLLAKQVPTQTETTIAHGDYRLDNTMIGRDGSVQAVLDWELCTLGHPLADLGTMSVYWTDRSSGGPAMAATAAEGFPTKAELVEMYRAASGRDVSDLPYYVAFAHWRLACIVEGVYARYGSGAMGGDRSGVEAMAQSTIHRAEMARAALTQL
ncbi:MAG TPA: phosphotransferase family protein [Acidimicrobiales bacterium]|nr:phosphotransferase family protein [Acidimicrobiales bacterium]